MFKIMLGKEEHWVKGEKRQWTIGQKSIAKSGPDEGKETFTGEYFYTSVESLLKHLLERKVRMEDVNTLHELKDTIVRCKEELMGMYDTEMDFHRKGSEED